MNNNVMMEIPEMKMVVVVNVKSNLDLFVKMEYAPDYVEMETLIGHMEKNVMIKILEVEMDAVEHVKLKMNTNVQLLCLVILHVKEDVEMQNMNLNTVRNVMMEILPLEMDALIVK